MAQTDSPNADPPLKLNLGCGEERMPGFTGVDLHAPGADVRLDLLAFPWPWADESVDEIHCAHFVEHIPQEQRWPFFEECWRILKPDARMTVIVPSWKSERAYGDMTHCWPPVTAMFFCYLDRNWRTANGLTYGPYAIRAHFEFQAGPTALNSPFAEQSPEIQAFACAHYLESYPDMRVRLTRKPL